MEDAAITDALFERFGERLKSVGGAASTPLLGMAARGSCRRFAPEPVDPDLVRLLGAIALSAPSKSDLQQRDVIVVADPELRAALDALIGGEAWTRAAPAFLLFCGDNRRQRRIHDWRGRAFANDHLDAFFNAAVDAALALGAFVTAAESVGLGCCPVSAVRNRAAEVSALVGLPDHVFPVAGLALGWPEDAAGRPISRRLPLAATLHVDRFSEDGVRETVEAYDREREAAAPYPRQRDVETYGEAAAYGWSEDKARQYAKPERADFGAFIRAKGFNLD